MRFQSFMKEIKKQRRMVEKRKKRKSDELSNPVRKKIRVKNQSQIQLSSRPPPSALSTSSTPPSLSFSSVPSFSSSHVWIHDVFPSFRGEDVRRDFLSHIQKEFQRKGITPFNDNGIKRGESIGPELIRGIRGSKIAIILLTRNYASSKWCLEELVEIMKCREELNQTVMAIFYKVDPSDVKKLTGDFGKVFRKTCEGQAKEDIRRWKQALEKVATIAGYHSSNWDNEAVMIEKIATDVLHELINSVPSSDFDNLVGMRAHMEKIEPLLGLDSSDVRMIGIWGPSGIGKSTIARVLHSKYSHQFQLCVFMENIKRRYPKPCFDEYSAKLQLQKEFLSQMINQEDLKINHLGVAQNRLKDKRVLVVLDDVDKSAQLDAMAKETQWFGPGSRIIVTTQDKKILNAYGTNHNYEVGFPDNDEALQIMCMYAFGQNSSYDDLHAWEVTKLVGNLPLGLRVMGSYFKGIPKHDWSKELPRLRSSIDGEIESILKFSYDALCHEDQALFLYIACFFDGERSEKVEAHLAENLIDVRQGLRLLAEKSLISISSLDGYKRIKMHNLLGRLGRGIVHKQSIHEPGKRQFLVSGRDISQVLGDDTIGSRSVIGIDPKYIEFSKVLKISDRAFKNMTSLQFLRLDISSTPVVIESLNYLPPELKLLHWNKFPMACLPSNFNPEFLVEINMPDSKLEKLWEGIKTIRNLKWMNLSGSSNLKELPDLSTANNLLELDLSHCSSLVELPFSIGNAINLQKLKLRSCSSLVGFPSSIWNVVNLQRLDINYCSSLVSLPSSSGNAIKLEVLNLSGCTILIELPSSLGNFTGLNLHRCSSLVDLPTFVRNSLNLEECNFRGCSSLVKLPSFFSATYLYEFSLSRCSSLVEIPSSIGNMTNLKKLCLDECSTLPELPSSIGNLHDLRMLSMKGCSKLKALPININMKTLDEVDLTDCSSLKRFPMISTNIRFLKLNGTAVEEIPPSTKVWPRLQKLHMPYSENLRKSQHAFVHIEELHLSDARIQEIAPWIKEMSRLHKLVIKGCMELVSPPQLPASLAILDAYNCESLERLDCSFNKKKFHTLRFVNCFKLNQEARDLILNTSIGNLAVFPGESVPAYFTYKATGSSLAMKWNGLDTHFRKNLRFKACVLLVNRPDAEARDWREIEISCCIKDKLNVVKSRHSTLWFELYPTSKEHLVVFEFEEVVYSAEPAFEFRVCNIKWKTEECGLRPLKSLFH